MIQLGEYYKPSNNRVLFNVISIVRVKVNASTYLPNRDN
jgi:hypothetical protein